MQFCLRGDENLCDHFQATGLHSDGGYAEFAVVSEDFAYPIPPAFTDSQQRPSSAQGDRLQGLEALRRKTGASSVFTASGLCPYCHPGGQALGVHSLRIHQKGQMAHQDLALRWAPTGWEQREIPAGMS